MSWTETALFNALEERHADRRQFALFRNVANGTGGKCERYADAIGMSLWPSKGLHVHGFEIKVSRSDWRREVDQPEKSAAFERYCHFWWIVAPEGVVPLDEAKSTWGLLEAREGKPLRIRRQATLNPTPELNHEILASILRRAGEASADKAALDAAYRKGATDADEDLRLARERCNALEQAIGVSPYVSASDVSAALGLLRTVRHRRAGLSILGRQAEEITALVAAMEAALDSLVAGDRDETAALAKAANK